MASSKTPEGILLKDLKDKLKWLECCGDVLWWGRLNAGKFQTTYGTWVMGFPKGTPDLCAFIRNQENGGALIFFEVKAPGDTKGLRPEQQEFFENYNKKHNIYCYEVQSEKDVGEALNKHIYDRTQDIEFNNE